MNITLLKLLGKKSAFQTFFNQGLLKFLTLTVSRINLCLERNGKKRNKKKQKKKGSKILSPDEKRFIGSSF